MSDVRKINDYYNGVYTRLMTLIRGHNDLYGCRLFKQPPNNKYFPHVQMYNETKTLGDQTLSYSERKYPITYRLELFAEDESSANKFEIVEAIENEVAEFMRLEGFELSSNRSTLNLDTNVHRVLMRFTALYDIDTEKLHL